MMRSVCVLALTLSVVSSPSLAQTGSTGAIAGTVRDQTGAMLPEADVSARSVATNETRRTKTQRNGTFLLPLLPPGEFVVDVQMGGFAPATREGVRVTVTETTSLTFDLRLEGVTDTIQVTATPQIVESTSNTLGRVVDSRAVEGLPLVTRNFTQVIGLSPGITADVTDAGALGRGAGGYSPPNAHGNRSYDNNFQMNGLGVNDIFSQGTTSGGVPVPNPDTISEFKVQTGQYDAAFGRNAGANVNLMTKTGSNDFRGSLFEFFRDGSLNANSFFSKRNGQPKPVLDQNQYGLTIGGPVVRNHLLFFGSYQGTRQTNGVSSLSTVLSPPLTDDRSAAAIGRLYAGQRGAQQNAMGGVGPAILADGSNINPVALRLLQMRLADGSYLMPTPQRVNPAAALAVQGSSTFSTPSSFDENQYMVNADYVPTGSSRISGRFFIALGNTLQAFPASNVPGFPLSTDDKYVASSVAHNWVLGSRLVNEARAGYGLLKTDRTQDGAFQFSDVGVRAAAQNNNLPTVTITGSYNMASSATGLRSQRTFLFEDSLSWVAGSHRLQLGGGFTKALRDFERFQQPGALTFQTFPDFLLGLSGAQNGTNLFSNVFVSVDLTGAFDRASRNWEGSLYVQDSYQVSSRLTINLGARWEYLPPLTDATGRPTTVDASLLNPNPPAAGSLAGIVVQSNYPGAIPAGVVQTGSDTILDRAQTSVFGPRSGFALRLVESGRMVIRGGYGLYFSRTTGQVQTQTTTTQPFGLLRASAGPPNVAATFENPFPNPIPTESSFPLFVPYTPASNLTAVAVDRALSPGRVHQFSLGVQTELARDLMWEIGYVGTRGSRLQRSRSVNQALLASASNPIRGETTNTVANINARKPYLGWSTSDLRAVEAKGETVYDGLETSVTKRYASGLQFLASYTYSKTIDSDGANAEANGQAGAGIGDQNDDFARRGPASFSRPHRFIASFIYELPWMKSATGFAGALASGWSVAGVATIQSGRPMTFTGANANNAFGFTSDRAQLASGCGIDDLVLSGSVADRIGQYFNPACVGQAIAWPVIGADGRATGFGNSGVGVVLGPGQRNLDLAISKRNRTGWPTSGGQAEFRIELFNALNTVNFGNPNTNVSSATFGQITSTTVSPRIVQLAVKLIF
ncbi:MAG: carboxypeptidase regulatory-like domain-containing protein [Vicinamibacterales bacterium]